MPKSWTDPELSRSTLVRMLNDWWGSNCGASGIPDRADFDIVAHKDLITNLLISDVETDPFRIRYRLVGTRIVRNLGAEFTGLYLDELIGPDYPTPWMDYYRAAYQDRRPLLGETTEPVRSGGTLTYEFGIFPVTLKADGAVKQFLAVEDYFGYEPTSASLAGLL